MKTIILIIISLFLISCSQKERIIQVINRETLKPEVNLEVSVLTGEKPVVIKTNSKGQISLGKGTWEELNKFISIKVTKENEVLFDETRSSPKENIINIYIKDKS